MINWILSKIYGEPAKVPDEFTHPSEGVAFPGNWDLLHEQPSDFDLYRRFLEKRIRWQRREIRSLKKRLEAAEQKAVELQLSGVK